MGVASFLTFLVHVFYVVAQSHFVVKDVQVDTGVTSVLSWKRSGYLKTTKKNYVGIIFQQF